MSFTLLSRFHAERDASPWIDHESMKRTSRSSSLSSSRSVTGATRSHKRLRSSSTCDGNSESMSRSLRVYIVQAKLDENTIHELHDLIEHSSPPHNLGLELCNNPADADIILTNIRMKKRLERHVDWKIAVCYHSSILHRSNNASCRSRKPLLPPTGFVNLQSKRPYLTVGIMPLFQSFTMKP